MFIGCYTVHVKIFVVDLISLNNWLAKFHKKCSLCKAQAMIFPMDCCALITKLTTVAIILEYNISNTVFIQTKAGLI